MEFCSAADWCKRKGIIITVFMWCGSSTWFLFSLVDLWWCKSESLSSGIIRIAPCGLTWTNSCIACLAQKLTDVSPQSYCVSQRLTLTLIVFLKGHHCRSLCAIFEQCVLNSSRESNGGPVHSHKTCEREFSWGRKNTRSCCSAVVWRPQNHVSYDTGSRWSDRGLPSHRTQNTLQQARGRIAANAWGCSLLAQHESRKDIYIYTFVSKSWASRMGE